MRIESLTAHPLSVPLLEPFVIATATMTETRSVLVRVRADDGTVGFGEAACLHPVTHEDQPLVLEVLERFLPSLSGASFSAPGELDALLLALEAYPVARAGVEMALLDVLARARKVPVAELFADKSALRTQLTTDVTIPILATSEMRRLARKWAARGFKVFKLKVGRSVEADLANVSAIASEVADASYRVDANGGYSADDALRFVEGCRALRLRVECFEQPCDRDDVVGLRRVRSGSDVPVVADESVRSLADLETLANEGLADGVNLKIVKLGGVARAIALGKRAKELGMRIMVGGMVETRLGMTAGAHVAAALGGADYVDLDTAFLLASDPFTGGYQADGPHMQLVGEGLGVLPV